MLSKDIPLPEVLKKKLEFGNREQIDALNEIECQIIMQEEQLQQKLSGEFKLYKVEIEWTGSNFIEIWASNKQEAQEIAEKHDLDISRHDIVEIDYHISEIKNK